MHQMWKYNFGGGGGLIEQVPTFWNITIKEKYEKEFTGLHPFTRYKFCIRTRLLEYLSHWSDTVCTKAKTEEAGIF